MASAWVWGSNEQGACGHVPAVAAQPASASPGGDADAADGESLEKRREAAERRRGAAAANLLLQPRALDVGRAVAAVACGEHHTLLLDRLGYVHACGRNREAR